MSRDIKMKKASLSEITKETFEEAIFMAYKGGITSVAPLGFSGDTIIIFEGEKEKGKENDRVSQISIRNYGNDAELLITDVAGSFIFSGRFHVSLGVDFLATQYSEIFEKVKHKILSKLDERPDFANLDIPDTATRSFGFDMLFAYQEKMRQGNLLPLIN